MIKMAQDYFTQALFLDFTILISVQIYSSKYWTANACLKNSLSKWFLVHNFQTVHQFRLKTFLIDQIRVGEESFVKVVLWLWIFLK